MIQNLFLYINDKIFQMLLKNRDFFNADKNKRQELINQLPQSIQSYLLSASEESFMADLKEAMDSIKLNSYSEHAKNNGLIKLLVNYLSNEVASLIDRLPVSFYDLTIDKRAEFLSDKLNLPETLVDIFSGNSYQDIFENSFNFIQKVEPDFPYVVIQLARDPESKTKEEMRHFFKQKMGRAFPRFQISKYLLGGMRVLVNGEMTDQSWKGKIERFTSQLSLNK